MNAEPVDPCEPLKSAQTLTNRDFVPDDVFLKLPACVRLNGEFVAIIPTEDGVYKYTIHVERPDGMLRPLTNDEELAFAISPGTRRGRADAATRVDIPEAGLRIVLLHKPWLPGDLQIVLAQLERDEPA